MKIATKGYRPTIRDTWNPAISLLISSCWSNDAALRPSLGLVMSSLADIMRGEFGFITVDTKKGRAGSALNQGAGEPDFAPGELWRRVQTVHSKVELGKELGAGAHASVYECTFQGKPAACKMFRNTTEESAFKEIETLFALRHPSIIGLYAWFQQKGGCCGDQRKDIDVRRLTLSFLLNKQAR